MSEAKEDKNPIIGYLHGVAIRRSNSLQLRLSESAYRDLVEQSFNTSISMNKIILLRNEPCQQCGCDNITIAITKKKYDYRIGENGGTHVKNQNGKGHSDTGEI